MSKLLISHADCRLEADEERTSSETTGKSRSRPPTLAEWPEEELGRIRAVLRRLIASRVRNPDDAEDLVQETFLTMTRKCHKIELRKGLLVWSIGILRRKVGNYYRRNQRDVPLEQVPDELDPLIPHVVLPEEELDRIELEALATLLVERLPPENRVVMELVLKGLTTHEIAERLGPEQYQNIVNRIHRGRVRLARELATHGYKIPISRTERRGRKRKRPI